ncbi:MAG TPA: aminopeptidase P family N-terminal domain-containing protein, partial [Micavibrio sp.]
MKQEEKLAALRGELRKQGVDGFLVPRADEFMGEYVPACNERLKEVSGFSGSAGIVAVLQDSAVVVTDSRYEIQVGQEVDRTLFDIKIGGLLTEAGDWLSAHAKPGSVIGYDPRLHSPEDIEALTKVLQEKNVSLKAVGYNPLDAVWVDRPRFISTPVVLFPEEIAGRASQDKRESIGAEIAEQGAQAAVLTEQASIAWLLNIRADDVPHTPFALSYAVLHDNGDVDWFIEQSRVSAEVREHLGSQVRICDPADLKGNLQALAREATNAGKTVMLDEKFSAIWFKTTLKDAGANILAREDPCIMPKARKTPQEQEAMRQAHLMDGVALTKFLCWLDREAPKGHLTELDVMDRLLEYRRENPEFLDTSFETIAGWNKNGATVHYRATPEKNSAIKPPGMLLLDSGGQYRKGTTDVTRTVAIGKAGELVKPDEEMKRVFTAVLRGHIG